MINPSLNSRISVHHDKEDGLSTNQLGNPFTPYCEICVAICPSSFLHLLIEIGAGHRLSTLTLANTKEENSKKDKKYIKNIFFGGGRPEGGA